jgi:hypothetical protein
VLAILFSLETEGAWILVSLLETEAVRILYFL